MKRGALLLTVALATFPHLAHAAPPAAPPTAPQTATNDAHREDPWEPANRRLYGFGQFLDRIALRPLAMCYRRWLPHPIRAGVANVLSNLDEPEIGVNDLLQGKPRRAGATALRFAINSTVGVVGVFDIAQHAGLIHHDNDAGVTLGTYRVGAGPYVYVPLTGPSNVRDLVGAGIDFVLDPLGWAQFKGADTVYASEIVVGAVDARATAEPDLRQLSLVAVDPYATLRSYYSQSREAMVRDRPLETQDLPDFPEPSATVLDDGERPAPATSAAQAPTSTPPSPPLP